MEYEATVEVFVDSLHAWVEKVNLAASGDFYLLGHSFGGYIAAEYAFRHPEKITKIILMSPIGVAIPPRTAATAPENYSCLASTGFNWARNTWDSGTFSPFDLGRVLGRFAVKPLITRSIQRRMHLEREAEQEALANYIHQLLVRKKSSEIAIT